MVNISGRLNKIQGSERATRKIVIPPGSIRLDSGEPDFSTPLHIGESSYRAIKSDFTHYTSAYGDKVLREAIMGSLSREYGIDKNIEDILITSGGSEAIHILAAAYIDPGDEVLVMDPDYSAYAEAVSFFGGRPIYVPTTKDFHLDLNVISEKISKNTKMIFLSSPCNPTGVVYTEDEIKSLVKIAREKSLLIVADEVYNRLIYDGIKHYSVCQAGDAQDWVVLVNSFSKTYAMTGWRVGYIVANSEIIKSLVHLQKSILICVNVPAQKACVTALNSSQDCIKSMVEEYDKRRKFTIDLLREIDGISTTGCEAAFYYFPRFDHNLSSKQLTALLSEKNLLVRSGTEFGVNGEKHIRITFATSMENIENGLKILKTTLDQLD